MNILSKLERKFGKYAIPNLMYYIVILYAAGMMIQMFAPQVYIQYLMLDASAILHGQIWRVITFLMWPSSGDPFINVLVIYCYFNLGRNLEYVWGSFRFNLYFFMGILGHVLAALVIYLLFGMVYPLTADYLNFSLFFAFAATFPEAKFLLFFVIPVKAKWLALFDAFFLVFGFVYGSLPQRIAIFLSLANFIIFFLMTKDFKKYSPKEVKRKQDFKVKTMRPVNRTHHKCAVCGRTDEESPGMEFRYCSKCEGSYEYCMDHLYTHQHVKKSDSPKS